MRSMYSLIFFEGKSMNVIQLKLSICFYYTFVKFHEFFQFKLVENAVSADHRSKFYSFISWHDYEESIGVINFRFWLFSEFLYCLRQDNSVCVYTYFLSNKNSENFVRKIERLTLNSYHFLKKIFFMLSVGQMMVYVMIRMNMCMIRGFEKIFHFSWYQSQILYFRISRTEEIHET